MKGWKNVGVMLPGSVIAIITAAGGADPKKGGMPHAMASILGALPWIGIALFKELPSEEYKAFAQQAKANMQQVWEILGSEDPPKAFDEACERARKGLH